MSSNVTHDGGANEPDEEVRHQAEPSRGHRQRAPWDTTSPRCVRKPDVSILLLASHKKTIETIFFWHSKATHTSRPLRARTQGTYGSFSELRKFRARTREIPAGSATPALLPQWWLRSGSAVVPQWFRTASALLPHCFRTASSLLPQWFRTSSAVDLHFFRSGSALLPQWLCTSSAVVLHFFRTTSALLFFR